MTFKTLLKTSTALVIAGSVALPVTGALAQDQDSALLEEIIVTATKKAGGVNIKDAPVAMTAFGATQLEALHAQDIQSLSYLSPNVQLETIGTAKGVANFSIRGLGINSSIPSIDPTVGVFVDGVYLGIIAGVVFDTFDLESVEVLRGPQGILFGRNVTGGAVLLNTKNPGDEFEMSAKASLETGLNYTVAGSISGPLNAEGTIKAKIAAYYNKDQGYFTNLFDGEEYGKSETTLVRGAVTFAPSDRFETTIKYELGRHEGDGPASKNNGLYDRDNFEFYVDGPSVSDNDWQNITWTTTLDVALGDGTITNIAGWRDFESSGSSDIDASPPLASPFGPLFAFHADFSTDQDQLSNELRYNGTFGNVDVTSGFFYFTQDINYLERRFLLGGLSIRTGGGVQDQTTWGAFTQFDYHMGEALTFNVGGRYSSEKKDVNIAEIIDRAPNPEICTMDAGCTSFDFSDGKKWSNFAPKVGFQWEANEDTNVYGFWTQAYRSGGYNFRDTSPLFEPGPFDEEKVSSFELGIKADLADNRLRLNAAVFHNTITNMQRELNLSDPDAGVVQLIRNTADAKIKGFELDMIFAASDAVTLTANVGYVDGDYTKVLFDLNGDDVVDAADLALEIPRLAPWTYGFGLLVNADTGFGELSGQVFFNHRDQAFYTDNNLGFLQSANMVDANLSLAIGDSGAAISVYGKNLLNEVTIGGDTQLPALFGPFPFNPGIQSTFSPLNKGRVIGVELKFAR
jgi:iron complex outermembrane receptor protein